MLVKTVLRTLEDKRSPLLRLADDGSADLKEMIMNAARNEN